jgi:hypothetical protein
MTRDETLAVLAHMAGAWPKPALQPEQVEVWVAHMGDVDADIAEATALELEAEEEFFPRIVRFRSRCADVARRRASTRGLGSGEAPRECELCHGTGWMEERTAVAGSTRRCRCKPITGEHRPGCTCMDCTYGVQRADRIRAGQDGTGYVGKDPLKRISVDSAWPGVGA